MNRQHQSGQAGLRHCECDFSRTVFRRTVTCLTIAVGLLTPFDAAFASEMPPREIVVSTDANGATAGRTQSVPPSKVVPPFAKSADEQELSKRSSDLDRQLLRDLLPDLPLDLELPVDKSGKPGPEQLTSRSRLPLADELDETVEAMREVSRRLDNKSLTEETEKLQTSIVSNIDLLIEKLQNRPLPGPPPSSDSSDENPQQDQQPGPQPQPQNTQQNQPGADSASRPGERPQAGKAGESTEQNLRQAQERAAALARRRALIDEVWGHLPPAMRERLLNVGSETLLPRYEEMIRRYYEALAEPERSDSRR